jgi:hypothetical protein
MYKIATKAASKNAYIRSIEGQPFLLHLNRHAISARLRLPPEDGLFFQE